MTPHELNIENWKKSIMSMALNIESLVESECVEVGIIPLTEQQKEIVTAHICAMMVGTILHIIKNPPCEDKAKALAELCGVK